MVTAINHKGTLCHYRSMLCQEGYCKECQIAIVAIDKASSKLGLCEDCGTDRATVLGMLKDNSDNKRAAIGILYGCPTCMEYFGGKR